MERILKWRAMWSSRHHLPNSDGKCSQQRSLAVKMLWSFEANLEMKCFFLDGIPSQLAANCLASSPRSKPSKTKGLPRKTTISPRNQMARIIRPLLSLSHHETSRLQHVTRPLALCSANTFHSQVRGSAGPDLWALHSGHSQSPFQKPTGKGKCHLLWSHRQGMAIGLYDHFCNYQLAPGSKGQTSPHYKPL